MHKKSLYGAAFSIEVCDRFILFFETDELTLLQYRAIPAWNGRYGWGSYCVFNKKTTIFPPLWFSYAKIARKCNSKFRWGELVVAIVRFATARLVELGKVLCLCGQSSKLFTFWKQISVRLWPSCWPRCARQSLKSISTSIVGCHVETVLLIHSAHNGKVH